MNTLPVIAGVEITTDEQGRFNLNALHKAFLAQNPSLHKNTKQPADWLKLEQAKELIQEISNSEDLHGLKISNSEDSGFGLVISRSGRYGGTFAHELLAVSYAGWISPAFQLKVNQVFLDYRNGRLQPVPQFDPAVALNDPATMRSLLLGYTEKVLALEDQVKQIQPKAEALDRIATADGSVCITDAAKLLQMHRPKDLFSLLQRQHFIYRRTGSTVWLGYQDKIQQGILEHKITEVSRGDGTTKVTQQVRITPKGIARLSELINRTPAA